MAERAAVEPLNGDVSDRMLYDPVTYRGGDGSWHRDFLEAVRHTAGPLTWDPGAVHSILSYGYPCGDSTLFREIKRKPWLSQVRSDGEAHLLEIPRHGRRACSAEVIAENLDRLLEEEIVQAATGHDKVMVLLSGGLDSRIVAGVAARALRKGRITVPVIGVTWGMANCRDVAYGQSTARVLGLEWIHVDLHPADLIANIELAAADLGGLSSPVHIHRMGWFEHAGPNTLVLAGSYGDSIGRAEFSSKHLLELRPLTTGSAGGLMTPEALAEGAMAFGQDLAQLRQRAKGEPRYVICDLEMQGHYMRGMISHVMDVINRYCTLYQAFTHPSVYEYVWSIHPSMRTDQPYAALLERLGKDLAALPWARTNRAVKGPTRGALPGLGKKFHAYEKWISGELFDRLREELDIPWLASTGLFNRKAIEKLLEVVRQGKGQPMPSYLLVWLISLQRVWRRIIDKGVTIEPFRPTMAAPPPKPARCGRLRNRLVRMPFLVRAVQALHRLKRPMVRRRALREFPPEQES